MKKVFFILVITILIAIGSYFFVQYFNKDSNKLYRLGYSEHSINYIIKNNLSDKINIFSDSFEEIIKDNKVKQQFIDDYIVLDYIDVENYGEIINKLLINGYLPHQINKIIKVTNLNNIDYLTQNKANSTILDFLEKKYYKSDNIKRYLDYYNLNNNFSSDRIIMEVNIGIDQPFYSNIKKSDITKKKLMLVNKYNSLDDNYKSSNLIKMDSKYSTGTQYLDSEAYKYLKELINAAEKDGIKIFNISAYRSFSTQKALYNGYVKRDGTQKADTYSARPGTSEHQTGLAVDLNTGSSSDHFENTKEYEWLTNNSYKYGYILRYPLGKEYITGYKFEPWHHRYVGVEAATKIHNEKISFEEYYVKHVVN